MNRAAAIASGPAGVPSAGGRLRELVVPHTALVLATVSVGLAAIAVKLFAPAPFSDWAFLAVSLLPVITLAYGPTLFGLQRARPWYLLAAGEAAFFIGDVILIIQEGAGNSTFPSLADAPYLVAYPLLALGVWSLITGRADRNNIARLDAMLIGICGALALWVLQIDWFVHDDALPMASRLVMLSYPLGDVLLVAGAAYLVLADRGRTTTAGRLILVSLLATLAADLVHARMLSGTGSLDGIADILWMLAYLLMALVPLVPSMVTLTERGIAHSPVRSSIRMAAVSLVLVPIFAVVEQITTGHVEWLLMMAASVAVVGVLLWRIHSVARIELERQVRLTRLLENASDAFAFVGADGRIEFCSAASQNLLGYDPARFLGRRVTDFLDLLNPEDHASQRRALIAVMRHPGAAATAELRVRHIDDTYRWLRVTATNRIGDPVADGVVLNYHDVTDEHEADDQLRFQSTILGSIHESVIATDRHGVITHWNDGAERIYGYSAHEMLGRSIDRLYPNRSGDALAKDLEPIRGGAELLGSWHGQRRDGTPVWVDIRTTVLRDSRGGPIGYVGVSRDVTAERAAEHHLARLQTAIDQASEGVMVLASNGTIEYVNPGLETMTGFGADELIGQRPSILSTPEMGPALYAVTGAALQTGRSQTIETTSLRKDGTPFEAAAVISPIHDGAGATTGYVVVARDVTEERRNEEAALKQARERALIADMIRGLDGRGTDQELAQAICQQLARLPDVQLAGMYVFEANGCAAPYGTVLAGHRKAPKMKVPAARAAYLLEQCRRGPWIEAWQSVPNHPYNALNARLGIRAVAYAPVRDGRDVVGFMAINSSSADAEQTLAGALPALVEFADITSTVLGPRMGQKTGVDTARAAIRAIISEHNFRAVFQPIVDVEVGHPVGYEGLTRFDDGVAPEVRFREAAALGIAAELEVATLREVIAASEALPKDAWLNVNLSPAVIQSSPEISEIIGSTARRIVVEVTEHEEIADYPAFRDAIHRLGPNVRLAVDDAGAGFASMRHIVELRPSFVKLDRAVIASIDADEARRALAVGMRQFARTGGFWLIAEGVETRAELRSLRELDIHLIQGYLLGRPAPAAELALKAKTAAK